MRATNAHQGYDKSFPVKDSDFRVAQATSRNVWVHCVEVAVKPQGVAVRDSRNRAQGMLFFTHDEWAAFLGGVKNGKFDSPC